ncbi:MAG: 30S ribosomal protein S7 [Candidatus Magasanikbacteria bacterium]|jgi:small subunit ribosomal protein S7|nr:30S ribosomal protein S7 [Candidatus Magasanikbacteria bacterium]
MPRGKSVPKRVITPDPIYNSELLAKFINTVMKRGKKSVAQQIVYGALETVKEKKNEAPLKVFETVIDLVRPQVEVRSKRVGGANYQVPLPVAPNRQNALAFRWLIEAARSRKGAAMQEKLATEMMDVLAGTGGALKKKEDVHRMAEANKAFAHFARFSRK